MSAADDYTEWHPARAVAEAAKRYTDLVNRRHTTEPARAVPRTAAEQTRADELTRTPCPAYPGFTHWFPPSLTECARGCGTTLSPELETTR